MIKKILIYSMALLGGGALYGQQSIQVGSQSYENAKTSGDLTSYNIITNSNSNNSAIRLPIQSYNRTPSTCYAYISPPAGTPNDPTVSNGDDTPNSTPYALPFTFCLYGTNYNQFYLNANGNISFNSTVTTFSSSPFPTTTNNPMLAPFWGDIDMRGVGDVYVEMFTNAVRITWENCGYYNQNTDKTVSFQIVMSDGTSPLLAPGNNVGFFYGDMGWTTGDASGGTNGFGGTPMTLGVDNADGTNSIQLGQFDSPGSAYDGPFGNNDGIDWLDDKYFMFNVCNSSNIPPIVNGIQVCDTLRICIGDSLPINFDVLAVEENQISGAFVDTTGVVGYNEISYTPGVAGANGNPASLSAYFQTSVMDTVTIGINYFDDGLPADTLTMDLVIVVDTLPYNPILSSDTTVCIGQLVDVGAGNYFDSYYWSDTLGNSLGTDSVESLPVGWNYLEVVINGCVDHDSIFIESFPDYTPVVMGDLVYCAPDSVLLNVDTLINVSYVWTENMGQDTLSQIDSIYLEAGNYNVAIVDTNGCSFNSDFQVSDFQSFISIQGNSTFCEGDSVLLTAPASFDTYTWSNGDNTNTTYGFDGQTTLIVSGLNGCLAYDTINVTEIIVPEPIILGQDSVCPGDLSILSFANPGYDNFEWLPSGANVNPITVFTGDYQLAVNYQGCADTSDIFPVVDAIIADMNMIFENVVCANDSVLLRPATNYANYSWSTGESTPGIYITQAGTYSVDVIDGNGCESDTSIIVDYIDDIPNLTSLNEACLGDGIYIENLNPPSGGGGTWGGFGPGNISYSPSSTFPHPTISVSEPGNYTIHFTHDECPFSDTVVLSYFPQPVLTILEDSIKLCRGESKVVKVITSDPANTYWNPYGETGDSIEVFNEGDYSVTLNNYCGILTENFNVDVQDCEIPNVITPNGDGQNEFFTSSLIETYSDVSLTIFNRWGRKVWNKESYDNSWNGVDNGGNKLAAGTYYYIIEYDNGTKTEKGFITLMK